MDPNIEATAQAVLGQLRRAGVTTGTGLTGYDLQDGAKFLYPVLTPLRNRIPRIKGKNGLNTNFKAVTGINAAKLTAGVGEGHRNAANTTSITTRSIFYATLGHDDLVTFEAIDAAQGWEDLPASTKRMLLHALMISEEETMLWGAGTAIGTDTGSITAALGQAAIASTAQATAGGSLAASTAHYIYCMPLTYDGVKMAGGYGSSSMAGVTIKVPFTRTNMGGTTDTISGGAGRISAQTTVTTGSSTSTNTITANATPIASAYGYAWFIGTAAGTCYLAAITSLPTFTFTSVPSAGQLASVFTALAADSSVDTLKYTGLIPYIAGSPLSYQLNGAGASLSSDGGRGVTQLNTAYAWFWNNYRTSPKTVWCSANKANQIDQLITKNSAGQNNFLVTLPAGGDSAFQPAKRVRTLVNPYTNTDVELAVHPNLNDNTMLLTSEEVPFPANGVATPWGYHFQRDYFGQDWPVNNRQYEYGIYTRGALALNAEMLFGIIYNLAS